MAALFNTHEGLDPGYFGLVDRDVYTEYQSLPLPIGKGVWRWWHWPSEQWHCIKVRSHKSGRYLLDNECQVLAGIQSKFVPRLIEKVTTPDQTMMVSSYANGPTLASVIRQQGAGFEGCSQVMMQLVDALVECHRSRIVHCDLKPNNLILSGSTIQLIDFGHSMDIGRDISKLPYRGFSPSYSHPALKDGKTAVTPDFDWYAFFVVMHVSFYGKLPALNRAPSTPLMGVFESMIQRSGLPKLYQRYLTQQLADLDLRLSQKLTTKNEADENKHRN